MRVHWFSITIFGTAENRLKIWADSFSGLGVLIGTEHGGRGYHSIDQALLGAKVYHNPIHPGKNGEEHFHIEIPGQACDCLVPHIFPTLLAELLSSSLRFSVKRLDLVFDDVPFSPEEFIEAIRADDMVSLAKRKNITIYQSPYEPAEDGSRIGTTTVYVGGATADRMVRLYDKRGPVRLEFQTRDQRAQAVALNVFSQKYQDWEITAKGHLRQYLDFINADWWRLFVNRVVREDLVISSARAMSFDRLERWLGRQVSVPLSVWLEVQGESAEAALAAMLDKAKQRNRSKYAAVLQLGDEQGE